METNINKTKVRYGVHYNDLNYEYALHSGRGRFLKNLADVINVIEYCVTKDLKKNLYKIDDKMYNVDVVRYVNDKIEESWNKDSIGIKGIIEQILKDNVQRNS